MNRTGPGDARDICQAAPFSGFSHVSSHKVRSWFTKVGCRKMYVAMLTAIDADEGCFLAMTADDQQHFFERVEV